MIECPSCRRDDFKTQRGLTQHLNQSVSCKKQIVTKLGGKLASNEGNDMIHCMPVNAATLELKTAQIKTMKRLQQHNTLSIKHQIAASLTELDSKRQRTRAHNAENATTTQETANNDPSSDNDSNSGMSKIRNSNCFNFGYKL